MIGRVHRKITNENVIRSISYSQHEILRWIIDLYCRNGFDLDPTYSTGVFYKDNRVPEPRSKIDINPCAKDVIQADCRDLPLDSSSVSSIIFDPPFIGGSKRFGKPGIIKKRFGYYKTVPIL